MEMDYGVGRILGRLKDLGIDRETMVVFTSDNGAETLHKGLSMNPTFYRVFLVIFCERLI